MLALILVHAACSCNKPADKSQQAGQSVGGSKPPALAQAEDISLFAGTKLLDTVPIALDFDRTGESFAAQFLPRESNAYQIMELTFDADGKLTPLNQLYSSTAQGRAYVRMHPLGQEAIILDNAQEAPGEPVVDTVWTAMNNTREGVPYLDLIPEFDSLHPAACYALEPIFTWDGKQIVIPLEESGMCVVQNLGHEGVFVAYPAIDFEAVGIRCQALPDQAGRRVALLRWYLGVPELEVSQIDIYNLDTGDWETCVSVPWPVYEISAQDVVNGPWLLSGSRFPEINTEKKRVPRLSRVDPASGALDLVEFYGEPYWNVSLDATGEYVAYMDQQRKALVRLKLATGEMDIDPTWFEPEAELFVSPGAEPVYAWKGNILYKANWNKHEQVGALEGW